MEHHAGLDVSLEETSVCIVDGAGKIIRETQVASETEALWAILHWRSRSCASGWRPGLYRSDYTLH